MSEFKTWWADKNHFGNFDFDSEMSAHRAWDFKEQELSALKKENEELRNRVEFLLKSETEFMETLDDVDTLESRLEKAQDLIEEYHSFLICNGDGGTREMWERLDRVNDWLEQREEKRE